METVEEIKLTELMEKAAYADKLKKQRRAASAKYRDANHERENERSKICMRAKYQRDKEARVNSPVAIVKHLEKVN